MRNLKYILFLIFIFIVVAIFIIKITTTITFEKFYICSCQKKIFFEDKEETMWFDVVHSANDVSKMSTPFIYDNKFINDINFEQYNVVISYGREINKIEYFKDGRTFNILPLKSRAIRVHFSQSFNDNKVYIYLIKKTKKINNDPKLPDFSKMIID